jgi:hypothetical protein
LLYKNMRLQLANLSLCYRKGILKDAIVWVRQSYVPIDFVVLETGGDVRAPIILGWPFLSTAKTIIYTDSTKIYFTIKDKHDKFSFKNRILQSPGYPQMLYLPEETIVTKMRNNWKKEEQSQAATRRIS